MSIALLSLFRLFTTQTVDTRITRVKDPEFLSQEPTPARELIRNTSNPIVLTARAPIKKPLRVSRIVDHSSEKASSGRMVISGTMRDVCAELDRLAMLENKTTY
jgi:hypothetical protein